MTPAGAITGSLGLRAYLSALRIIPLFLLPLLALSLAGETIVLEPVRDTTIYSENNAFGNGAGNSLFVGKTSGKANDFGVPTDVRRALLAFAFSEVEIPQDSNIDSVRLTLEATQNRSSPVAVSLHRLTADWGEGSANSTLRGGGQGVLAGFQDATWVFRFNNLVDAWTNQGGDFDLEATAISTVSLKGGFDWSSPEMIVDVQGWLNTPSSNFGWILIGDESSAGTAKRFDSREGLTPPKLVIEFTRSGGGQKQEQTITFNLISDHFTTDPPFLLNANASSGLAVTFSILSGPATVDGSTLTLTGVAGIVTVLASQAGNEEFKPAPEVERSFAVSEPEGAVVFGGLFLGENFFFSEWYGIYNITFFPWVFHLQHGFQFVFPTETPGEVFLFDLETQDFWWTTSALYPAFYSFGRSTFNFYFKDSANPRNFVDLETEEFYSVPEE